MSVTDRYDAGWYTALVVGFVLLVACSGAIVADLDRDSAMDAAVDQIKADEGFRGHAYSDTRGYVTIGYGTRLPIRAEEAEELLRSRLSGDLATLATHRQGAALAALPSGVLVAVLDMLYQLGPDKAVREFDDMVPRCVGSTDYPRAARELPSPASMGRRNAAARYADCSGDRGGPVAEPQWPCSRASLAVNAAALLRMAPTSGCRPAARTGNPTRHASHWAAGGRTWLCLNAPWQSCLGTYRGDQAGDRFGTHPSSPRLFAIADRAGLGAARASRVDRPGRDFLPAARPIQEVRLRAQRRNA